MSMGGGLRSSQSTGHSTLAYLLHHSILPYFFSFTLTPALLVLDLFFTLYSPHRMAKHLKRAESRKSHSWLWDSHISPTTSKWLSENLDQVDQSVKRMLKLIEEDGDSLAKKAQMFYQKLPELSLLVEEFYRMYRSLAERYESYDHLIRELRKKFSSNHQSQTSSISESAASDLTSASGSPPPLGLAAGSGSFDVSQKEADESSSSSDSETSESELDDSSITNHTDDPLAKVAAYEKELQIANEKMQLSQAEITRLMLEVQNHKSLEGAVPESSEGKMTKKYLEERTGLILKGQLREHKSRCESLIGENTIIRLEKAECESKIKQLKEEIHRLEGSLESLRSEKDRLQKETAAVRVELRYRDEQVVKLEGHLHQLHVEHAELEDEIERRKKVIADCWEEKREAIRQLCFSMEHYRSSYHRLRQALGTGNRLAMAVPT